MIAFFRQWGLVLAPVLVAVPAYASADPSPPPFKLSIGDYFYSADGAHYTGQDFNLRYRRDDTSLWIGHYHDPLFGSQTRAGADTSWQPVEGVDLAIQPSVQVATQHFIGGSVNVQVGGPWFALIGIGRTNLRPYQNLNFDPNDAVTVGVGHHGDNGDTYSLTTIKDDRLGTGQRHTHLTAQWSLPHRQRLTLDLLRKIGQGDTGAVHAWGESATYDFPAWFVRVVHDPKQNFGAADAVRVTVGARF